MLEVNEDSLLGISHEEAVKIMRNSGSTIRLVVCDGYDAALVSRFYFSVSKFYHISSYDDLDFCLNVLICIIPVFTFNSKFISLW